MKSLKYLLAVAGLMGAFALSAQAHLEFVGAVDFDSQPNNNPDSNLAALGEFVDTTGFILCGNSDDRRFWQSNHQPNQRHGGVVSCHPLWQR